MINFGAFSDELENIMMEKVAANPGGIRGMIGHGMKRFLSKSQREGLDRTFSPKATGSPYSTSQLMFQKILGKPGGKSKLSGIGLGGTAPKLLKTRGFRNVGGDFNYPGRVKWMQNKNKMELGLTPRAPYSQEVKKPINWQPIGGGAPVQ